jgi:hypothetical protein
MEQQYAAKTILGQASLASWESASNGSTMETLAYDMRHFTNVFWSRLWE